MSAGFATTALWFIAATPGMMTNQMTLQRVCAANSAKNARRTLIGGGILIAGIELWVVVVGNACRVLNPGLAPEDASGWFLTQIPTWVLALFSGFIATTILSTTDSALQSVSVNLTQDIYKQCINPKDSRQRGSKRLGQTAANHSTDYARDTASRSQEILISESIAAVDRHQQPGG